MNIVVTGSAGRLGSAVARFLARRHNVTAFARADLDFLQPQTVRGRVNRESFDCLINCAALTNVDYCERNPEEADTVNARTPEMLAELCAERGARMVHISTDYVFGGETPGMRTEEDPAVPLSIYGRSKLAGEHGVLSKSRRHIAARVSWVFGPDRDSFIESIAQRALESDRVEAIADKYSSPTYTLDCAEWIEALAEHPDAGGVFHLCNKGETSWREYGEFALKRLAGMGVPLRTQEVHAITLADLKQFVAKRPVHTAMHTGKFSHLTRITPRTWQEALSAYVHDTLGPRLLQMEAIR
jgi:dTDP-4-dehydrorhamnose reductase